MALPPAIRLMAIGTMVVFCYLCVQIFQAPSSLSAGKDAVKLSDMPRDPNLDRTYISLGLSILSASDMYL
jgi:mannosyltransferase